ncbi:hypothetical protein M3Y97_00466200 [Aphelenchoides bicaudatus]|nr:hypothetical protein M3Y97_00466200 [Aphelenchoides bicaudatus]
MIFNKSHPSIAFGHGHISQLNSVDDETKVLPNWTNPALYKTRMCDHYRTKGDCKFGLKCWFAHHKDELRSVPRLDRHPEAALSAVNQVIESLPPSRSRKVAMSKSQQLYDELMIQKKDHGLQRQFVYYRMPSAVFWSRDCETS